MTRDLPPEDEKEPDPSQRPPGHVNNTTAGALAGFAVAGFVVGLFLRTVSIRLTGSSPNPVGWVPALALVLVAAIIGGVAWLTYRDLHRRGIRLEPHKAVNRLVLAKACALSGSAIAGGYFGYALSWWRFTEGALTRQRLVQSLVAAVAGVLIVVGSLLLERACRVRDDDDADIP